MFPRHGSTSMMEQQGIRTAAIPEKTVSGLAEIADRTLTGMLDEAATIPASNQVGDRALGEPDCLSSSLGVV